MVWAEKSNKPDYTEPSIQGVLSTNSKNSNVCQKKRDKGVKRFPHRRGHWCKLTVSLPSIYVHAHTHNGDLMEVIQVEGKKVNRNLTDWRSVAKVILPTGGDTLKSIGLIKGRIDTLSSCSLWLEVSVKTNHRLTKVIANLTSYLTQCHSNCKIKFRDLHLQIKPCSE